MNYYLYGNFITIDSVGLTFDALDRMVEQNRSGVYTQIVYAPGGAKLALMNGQSLVKGFVPLPGGAAAVYSSSGLDHYRHPDWLGSARVTSSPTRTFLSSVAYAPLGETYASSGTLDLSFTGQNQDTVSGDYDFLFREYSTQGRWASPDPAGLGAVDPSVPQSWNRYAYVLNNPLASVDPLGLDNCVFIYLGTDAEGTPHYKMVCTPDPPPPPSGPAPVDYIALSMWAGSDVPQLSCTGFVSKPCAPPPPPKSTADRARCAAANASSLAKIVGISNSNFLGQAFLGNDVSTISNLVTGPQRGNAVQQFIVGGPTKLNLIAQVGYAVGTIDTGRLALTQTASIDAFGNPKFWSKAISVAETGLAKSISKAFAVVSAAKLVYDAGAYGYAYYRCGN